MTRQELYKEIRARLCSVGVEADTQARLLMEHVFGASWSDIVLGFHLPVSAEDADHVLKLARERAQGRPLAYVMGTWSFCGAPYIVDERVLIPRLDSECVAQAAIRAASERQAKTAADICCGSGCLGITLARHHVLDELYLSDISPKALEVASANAGNLLEDAKYVLLEADLLDGLNRPVDLIVCNPPYVSETEYAALEEQIRLYEPKNALVASEDGLFFYKKLAEEASAVLTKNGVLIAEIGDTQSEAVCEIFARSGWQDIQTGADFSGLPRYICASAPDTAKKHAVQDTHICLQKGICSLQGVQIAEAKRSATAKRQTQRSMAVSL